MEESRSQESEFRIDASLPAPLPAQQARQAGAFWLPNSVREMRIPEKVSSAAFQLGQHLEAELAWGTDLLSRRGGRRAGKEGVATPMAAPAPVRRSEKRAEVSVAPACAAGAAGRSERSQALAEIAQQAASCTRCELCRSRTQVVFGVGPCPAELMIIGEGPGAEEDRQGEPFVGLAGQLLNRLLAEAGLRREKIYITNVVKCRPPGNRTPLPDEIVSCGLYLRKQIELVNPHLVLALGRPAAQTLLRTAEPIGRLRGRFFPLEGHPTSRSSSRGAREVGPWVLPTFHPAYLLRNPVDTPLVKEDLRRVVEKLRAGGENRRA